MTTGLRPFEAATDFEVIARVQKCLYRPPEQVSPGMPESLGAVIRRAMTADRDQRYRTADEFLVDLEAVWRAEYGAPGQTELKLWLADLARVDGSAPTGRTGVHAITPDDGPGDLAEGAALVLGDEGSDRGGRTARLRNGGSRSGETEDTALALLPEIGALEASLPEAGTRSERGGPRRRGGSSRSSLTGVEATAMSDLSLQVADGDDVVVDRLRGRTRRRMVGTGFLVFVLLGGGATAALWRLAVSRQGAPELGEGAPAPLSEPPAARAAVPPPPPLPLPPVRKPAARTATRAEPRELQGEPRELQGEPREARGEPRPSAAELEAEAEAREAERRRARELRWSLPSDQSTGLNGADLPPLPRPTPPAPTPARPTPPTPVPPLPGETLPPLEEAAPLPPREPAPTERPAAPDPGADPLPAPSDPVVPEDPPAGSPRPPEATTP